MAQKQSSVLSAASSAARKDKTVPIKESIEKIKGHGTLTIYRMEKSPYFYVRLFEGGKILRKSTKCTERKTAIDFAKRFFVEVKTKQLNREPLTAKSGFEVCALGLLKENKARLARGEVSEKKVDNDDYRLKKDLLPFFRKYVSLTALMEPPMIARNGAS
jgi:hypothetical protein